MWFLDFIEWINLLFQLHHSHVIQRAPSNLDSQVRAYCDSLNATVLIVEYVCNTWVFWVWKSWLIFTSWWWGALMLRFTKDGSKLRQQLGVSQIAFITALWCLKVLVCMCIGGEGLGRCVLGRIHQNWENK